jgi:archaellum biogenesis protein FlaJ (TadC family)
LPCAFLSLIFFDKNPQWHRGEEQIEKEDMINRWLTVAGPIRCFILLVINWSVGPTYRFEAAQVLLLGQIFGIAAAILWIW